MHRQHGATRSSSPRSTLIWSNLMQASFAHNASFDLHPAELRLLPATHSPNNPVIDTLHSPGAMRSFQVRRTLW